MKTFLLLLLFYLGFTHQSEAQTAAKPNYKTFEFAYYTKYDDNDKLAIRVYFKADSTGRVGNFSELGGSPQYFCFMLPDSTIGMVNIICDPSTSLKSYMIKESLGAGKRYEGYYCFAARRGADGSTEYLTYIDPFMTKQFMKAEDALFAVFLDKLKTGLCRPFQIDETFLFQLKEYHQKAKNLPEKELPPAELATP